MRALAVVRCGDASLHGAWANGARDFDVAVSYFGDDSEKTFPEADYVHRIKGGKWDGLAAFFRAFPETVERYDYFWLPDDDISATTEDINRMFEIGRAKELQAFQPALDERSYYSHLITIRHASFKIRYANFVEVMVPVISRSILKKTLPLIQTSRSGFGLDFVWPEMAADLARDGAPACAIVDEVTVCHTRPVGGSLHMFMQKTGGKSTADEMTEMMAHVRGGRTSVVNGVASPAVRNLSGVDHAGRTRTGVPLMLAIAGDVLWRRANRMQPVKVSKAARHALKVIWRP